MNKTRMPIRLGSLTSKQAILTLLLAILISAIAGGTELFNHVSSMRQDVAQRVEQQLAIINGAAAEAAFQLNPDLAHQIAYGLFSDNEIAEVAIRDDFGSTLAEFSPSTPVESSWLSQRLFGDMLDYRVPLNYFVGADLPDAVVGEVELRLDEQSLTQQFLERSISVVGSSVMEAFILSLLIIAFFHYFITRPLLKVHDAITHTDPERPGQWAKPQLPGHRHDELGHLVDSLDDLLQAFQQGLHQRDQLHHLSHIDGLTGVANRRHFDLFYQQQWQHAQQHAQPLAIIFIDIDNFKEFNDHYGHAMGDDTLRAVAQVLNHCIDPATDLLARYGGEEFVCVLPNKDEKAALGVAQRLRQGVLSLSIPHAYSSTHTHLTASMGVASTSTHATISATALLAQADQHLYHAKHLGRNRIEARPRIA
ncbi:MULTISPECIES: GGDEF domain-containing protein [unclassified Halomonas]|uniref:GGDEF domain-containing protein n=1 Tax=unclassified Halomonas TaxID=2609666 RepID=UPI0006DA7428|nr:MULTISPECIES: diguanylate cyclase [unclassified Halomonas]KPQ20455.1 MAG: Response regulator containing a CheY-like receiver domain and a GGDEF domain [Halomonas sp. HL-93]SBR46305.1 sigma-B regulation protein RsbU (phosphoserine phosphatase) [Halomonas sp. HL-93]SNY98690.1 Diguanylate cyclase, GGDEF domain [Halomonas sp. hl-4]